MRIGITALGLASVLAACESSPSPQQPRSVAEAPRAVDSTKEPASDDGRMTWWREARFGMFIHWGLYAIPAGRWGDNSDHGEWIRTTAQIPLERYEELQGQFNPTKFDADAWARTAADAGMKYLVITSKHHDGFCLFDSAQTEWDVMNTPFARDILKELSEACARHGVRFCTYHSIMDWHHPDYLPRRTWEQRSTQGADFERFVRYLRAQVSEVITKYDPGVLWFDGEWENTWTHERGVALYELCRSLDADLIVNNRVDVHRGGMAGFSEASEAVGDFGTPEQEIPATGMPGVDWETCMTMNDHWGYNAADPDWKSAADMIRMLVDVASKGGNYLLNVGPRADGTFPDEAVERLRDIGVWMKRHGDSIHGTSASPFDVLPWGRCTVKSAGERSTLYLHVFERPDSGDLVLPGLGSTPISAGYLAGPRLLLPVARRGSDVVVHLPGDLPDPVCAVVALSIQGEPIVYRTPTISAAADQFVHALDVTLSTPSTALEIRYTLDGSDPAERSPVYTRPLALTRTATVSARAFHAGKAVSAVARREFERVTPKAATQVVGTEPGLTCELFEGEWDRLPDFEHLTPLSSQVVREVALAEGRTGERIALRFTGYIELPRDDAYTFALTSDDGSDLWIDGERVVDNDGLHGTLEQRGAAALSAGAHELRVRWFNKTGGAALGLKLAPLGGELKAPAPATLMHAPRR